MQFVGQPFVFEGRLNQLGVLQVGPLEEEFLSPLNHWTVQAYQWQWRMALQNLLQGEALQVALVTELDLDIRICRYVLHRERSEVYIREHHLHADLLGRLLSEEDATLHLPARHPTDAVWEWHTCVQDLQDFLNHALN